MVDSVMANEIPLKGRTLTDDESVKINHDGIRAQLSSLHIAHEPILFAQAITERAHISHAAMAMGSATVDDSKCDLFLEAASAKLESVFSTFAAVTAGRTRGVSAEHLSKCG